MKQKIALFLVVFIIGTSVFAKNVVDYLVDAPSYLIPTLGSSFRLELAENFLNGTKDSLKNASGNIVWVHQIDTANNYVSMQITANSRLEIKLLSYANDTIIGISQTVCASICSSYLHFFDTAWNKIAVPYPKLTVNDWKKIKDERLNDKTIHNHFPASFIEYTFSAINNELTAKNHSLEFVSFFDKKQLSNYLHNKDIVMKWTGKEFEIATPF